MIFRASLGLRKNIDVMIFYRIHQAEIFTNCKHQIEIIGKFICIFIFYYIYLSVQLLVHIEKEFTIYKSERYEKYVISNRIVTYRTAIKKLIILCLQTNASSYKSGGDGTEASITYIKVN